MSLMELYYEYVEGTRDARTITWPLSTVSALVIILFNYFYFIYGCGPRFMKNRKPYDLKNIIRVYNVFQIFTNAYLVYKLLEVNLFDVVSCSAVTRLTDSQKLKVANFIWWAYVLKIFDLVETFFFVLRKKNRQISFLHVHHHAATVFLAWLGIRYQPHGLSCLIYVLNCSVHVFMYIYYFLSSINSRIQKIINPYKSILTGIQIGQLTIMLTFLVRNSILDCGELQPLIVIAFINILINLYCFYDFYRKTYSKSKEKSGRLTQ